MKFFRGSRVPAAAPGLVHHPDCRLRAAGLPRFPCRRADVRLRDVHPVRAGVVPAMGCGERHAPVDRKDNSSIRVAGRVSRWSLVGRFEFVRRVVGRYFTSPPSPGWILFAVDRLTTPAATGRQVRRAPAIRAHRRCAAGVPRAPSFRTPCGTCTGARRRAGAGEPFPREGLKNSIAPFEAFRASRNQWLTIDSRVPIRVFQRLPSSLV